jgi:hypothetical protein
MFKKTANPYNFKYLQTGISGPGIQEVFLPELPKSSEILFKKEQKWSRVQPSDILKKAIRDYAKEIQNDPNYVSPMQASINQWADQEWERSEKGVWFWNNGVATYLTGFHYWYLTAWQTYFGFPTYRETDKEICYLIEYCRQDPDSYGICFNTIRRYGKSSLMGAWVTYNATRNGHFYAGMQGETDKKVKKFYRQMIRGPFKKLPFYYTPQYDTNSTLEQDIRFETPAVRGKTVKIGDYDDSDDLESSIEFRPSGPGEYDGAVLHAYLMEEPGKTLECDINDRWEVVKPCLKKGNTIRGKAFMGTTVEFMDVGSKGGKAYKKIFYESDFDHKQPDGRTKSGMYACFLPGDCAYEGFFDEWGHPIQDRARQSILLERESAKKDPKKLSGLIRKYPLSIKEIFYVNIDRCEFNAMILQDRNTELSAMVEPILVRGKFEWKDKKRFGEIVFRHDDVTGWAWVHSLITDPRETNLVERLYTGAEPQYSPRNNNKYIAGVDPIDHGIIIEGKGKSGDEEFISTRRSKPVLFIKRKYDSSIDGVIDQNILEARSENGEKFPYKTNRYVAMMDVRPGDPNVFFERCLMMCWYFGCSLHPESQKPGVINHFYLNGCEDFILSKYTPEGSGRRGQTDGTPASGMSIQEYTSLIASYVEHFGHTIPFPDLIDDLLQFNPKKTTEYDYSVAMGFTELGERIRPKTVSLPMMDIHDIMPGFDEYGNVVM